MDEKLIIEDIDKLDEHIDDICYDVDEFKNIMLEDINKSFKSIYELFVTTEYDWIKYNYLRNKLYGMREKLEKIEIEIR